MHHCFKVGVRKLFISLLMAGIGMLAPRTASAQFRAGGGLVFGSYIETLGIQVNGNYLFDEENGVRFAGDLTFFFPNTSGIDFTRSVFAINGNGHYIFTTTESILAYALAGLNIAVEKLEYDSSALGRTTSDTQIGLNLGAGIEYEISIGYLYGEAKIVIGGFDQLELGGGIRVPFGN